MRTLVFLAMAGLASQILVAQPATRWNARVKLQVSASEELSPLLISLLSSELRSLGDIAIVETEPEYTIGLIAVTNRVGGRVVGYTLSTLVESHLTEGALNLLSEELKTSAYKSLLVGLVKGMSSVSEHSITAISPEDLERTCKKIVADVDVKTFQVSRDLQQKINDAARAAERKP